MAAAPKPLPHRRNYSCPDCKATVLCCDLCTEEARLWVPDVAWEDGTLYLCEGHALPFQAWAAVSSVLDDQEPKAPVRPLWKAKLWNALSDASPLRFSFGVPAPSELAAYMPGDDGCGCDTWGT